MASRSRKPEKEPLTEAQALIAASVELRAVNAELRAVRAESRSRADDVFELAVKGAGYLLTAHGAAIAGCLSQLKELNSNPALKGFGIYLTVFVFGFFLAMVGYIMTAIEKSRWIRIARDAKDLDSLPSGRVSSALLCSSAFLLQLALFEVAFRLIKL